MQATQVVKIKFEIDKKSRSKIKLKNQFREIEIGGLLVIKELKLSGKKSNAPIFKHEATFLEVRKDCKNGHPVE